MQISCVTVKNWKLMREKLRYKENNGMYCNAQMSNKLLRQICKIDDVGYRGISLLKRSVLEFSLVRRDQENHASLFALPPSKKPVQ